MSPLVLAGTVALLLGFLYVVKNPPEQKQAPAVARVVAAAARPPPSHRPPPTPLPARAAPPLWRPRWRAPPAARRRRRTLVVPTGRYQLCRAPLLDPAVCDYRALKPNTSNSSRTFKSNPQILNVATSIFKSFKLAPTPTITHNSNL